MEEKEKIRKNLIMLAAFKWAEILSTIGEGKGRREKNE